MNLRRLRLRTILLAVNLLVLALPLGGIAVLRIYESALIRQTETELIAQGAFIASSYRAALERLYPQGVPGGPYGRPMSARWRYDDEAQWRPRPAVLDLALDDVRPPPPEPGPAGPADPIAAAIGAELTPVLRDAQGVTLAGMRIVDAYGVIVASTGADAGRSLAAWEEIGRALEGENVSLLRARDSKEPSPPLSSISRGTRVRAYVVTPILVGERVVGAVALIRTPKNILQALYGKRRELVVGTLLLLALVGLIALFTSFAISRPVRGLIIQARRAMAGERGAMEPLAHPVTREVEHLSQRLAEMARTLEARAEYIQSFAQHVSHEFKTPLTAIRGTVELLEEHADTMTDAERKRFLRNLDEDASRLSALVTRLLELARADVSTAGEGESAEVAPVIEALVERYEARGLGVSAGASGEAETGRDARPAAPCAARVAMAPETLDSVLASLLDNARQHGASRVSIDVHPGADSVRVTLTDDGPGITCANAERVFEPFFTTARDKGGTGLGLTVVRSLLAAHRGAIALEPARGASFAVTLPRAS